MGEGWEDHCKVYSLKHSPTCREILCNSSIYWTAIKSRGVAHFQNPPKNSFFTELAKKQQGRKKKNWFFFSELNSAHYSGKKGACVRQARKISPSLALATCGSGSAVMCNSIHCCNGICCFTFGSNAALVSLSRSCPLSSPLVLGKAVCTALQETRSRNLSRWKTAHLLQEVGWKRQCYFSNRSASQVGLSRGWTSVVTPIEDKGRKERKQAVRTGSWTGNAYTNSIL